MTHREKLTTLLEEMGIPNNPQPIPSLLGHEFSDQENHVILGCGDGYGGFVCDFKFDGAGQLLTFGCWE